MKDLKNELIDGHICNLWDELYDKVQSIVPDYFIRKIIRNNVEDDINDMLSPIQNGLNEMFR